MSKRKPRDLSAEEQQVLEQGHLRQLGRTAGWKRDAEDFYEKNDAPKQIWVRELVKKACCKLRAPQLPPSWAKVEEALPPRCTAKVREMRSFMEWVRGEVPEFRRAQALGYPVAGLICLTAMARAQVVVRGPQDLAQYADTMSQAQMRALRFRSDSDGNICWARSCSAMPCTLRSKPPSRSSRCGKISAACAPPMPPASWERSGGWC